MKNIKVEFIFILVGLFALLQNSQAQSEHPSFISISPEFSTTYAQLTLLAPGIEVGYGIFNERNFYTSAVLGYNYYFNLQDDYERSVKSHGFKAGLKFKLQIIGNNKYMSTTYIENARVCLDFATRFNFNPTKSYDLNELKDEGNVSYISSDIGLSIMIPYSVISKNNKKLLNRSDLFLEIYESILVDNDIGLVSSSATEIYNVTLANKIMLSWVYQFRVKD